MIIQENTNPKNHAVMKKLVFIPLLMSVLFLGSQQIFAQSAPDPPSDHGSSNNSSPGGGAPIGDGLVLLLTMGAAYGGLKGYRFLKTGKKS